MRETTGKTQRHSEAHILLGWVKMLSRIGPFTIKPDRVGSDLMSDVDMTDSLPYAKLAAMAFEHPNPELFKHVIEMAAMMKHRRFFVELGKCLSGDIDRDLWDKRDVDIAEIVLSNPRIPAKDAVHELEKRGHSGISVENFRNWKSKLLKAKRDYEAFQSWKP
jgi:hypothetical protein